MSAWKSRWSWVRLVNRATSKWIASAAVQGQRVRGDLHRAGPVAAVEHPPEGRLQVDRLRRGPLDLLLDPADHLLHGPQQAALDPRRLEHLPQQEGGGRLAVGPGDPGDPQLRRRVAKKRAATGAIAARASATTQLRDLELAARARPPAPPPPPDRGGGESCPSAFSPGTQKKSVPGPTLRLS